MKKLFFIITAAASISLCACHKSPATPLLEEHPVEDYMFTKASAVFLSTYQSTNFYDYGYEFKSSRSGKIIKLGCRMAALNSVNVVSVWDADTHALILSKQVTNTDQSNFIYVDLTVTNEAISIPANKNYIVNVHPTVGLSQELAAGVYDVSRNDKNVIIPFTDQAITVTGLCAVLVPGLTSIPDKPTLATFPSTSLPADYLKNIIGMPDIGFQANDF